MISEKVSTVAQCSVRVCRSFVRLSFKGAFPCAAKGGDLQKLRGSQERRFASTDLVDRVVELDSQWRDGKHEGQPTCTHEAKFYILAHSKLLLKYVLCCSCL